MAVSENDETLQLFLEEAREHLQDIETDLLEIERNADSPGGELVNKVFRGIHSIKGAAGFFGLTRMKDLAHGMENLLNRMRNAEVRAERAVVEALLRAADLLNSMVEAPEASEQIEIASALSMLKSVAPESAAAADRPKVKLMDKASRPVFDLSPSDLESACKGGKSLYLLTFDLVQDVEARGKSPLDLLRDLEKTGLIVESTVRVDRDGLIEGSPQLLPFQILYATVLDEDMTVLLTGLSPENIRKVDPATFDSGKSAPGSGRPAATKGKRARKKSAEPLREPLPEPPMETAPRETTMTESVAIPDAPLSESRSAGILPGGAAAANTLRVNVKVLDRLMTLAGELVLARNQLVQKVSAKNHSEIQTSSQGLSMIISELQEAVMSTRMQPLSIVFGKYHRVVRDMAGALGKDIRLEVDGEDVELDKTVIESIGDPLTHLVRNAVDHGVEANSRKRVEAGKPATATIRLNAFHEAGKVVVEVSDDGRGIDTDLVKAKALERRLVEPAALDRMSEKEIIDLIFLPGFSTASQVTDISGRGVGMDVVKTNFTRLGGVIEIESRRGEGSVFRVKLPLTLAIIPSLLVSVEDETFAIPQVNLVELVRIPARDVRNRIERIGDALVMRLRGRLLPLIRLSDALGMGPHRFQHPETGEWMIDKRERLEDRRGPVDRETRQESARRTHSDRRFHSASAINVAVLSAGAFQYGLIVDRLHESEEIVVKPLGRHLAGTTCYAGATILGDGRVSLILDVMGLSRQLSLRDVGSGEKTREEERNSSRGRDTQSLLLFEVAEGERFAVPLALVSRLEVVPRNAVERPGGRRAMQYRGGSLPLLDLADVAKVGPVADVESWYVVVFAVAGREVGLLASQIVDIAEVSDEVDEQTFRQDGILGSAIVGGSTTLLVDLWGVVRSCLPGWIPDRPAAGGGGERPPILVVDDSPFYRGQISTFLTEVGYEVVQAEDGSKGLEALEARKDIGLVLTDIEMPVMDGLEFVRRIRASERLRGLPVVAVTSLSGEDAQLRGRLAGVDQYMVKLDREKIVSAVETFVAHGRT
ncbi:MAG: chemotaxis protein CheW [Fibrobacteria bacterium]|nr:chemotaxis protein CheW [Fibrobacteria bacterium]